MQKPQTIKIGKVELPVNDGTSPHVPKQSMEFIDHDGILNAIAIGVRDNMAILLIGETGTGKTSAIRNVAEKTKNGLRRINLNGGTTADELVGRTLLNEKGTIWVDGALTEAMRRGEWILFDEINAALPEVLFVLQSILDDDGYLVLTEKDDKEIVRRHPNFRFFASCNPPNYAGTKELNRALLSRFPIAIDASYPSPAVEKDIIKKHLGDKVSALDITENIMNLAKETRKSYQEGKTDIALGTRDILNFLKLTRYMSPRAAIKAAFIGKLNIEDQVAVQALVRLHLPADKTGTGDTLQHVTNIENELLPSGTYVIDADVNGAYASIQKKTKASQTAMEKEGSKTLYSNNPTQAIKGDTFKLIGLYRQGEAGISKAHSTNPIVGALAEFKTGVHKGQLGFILIGRPQMQPLRDALYAKC